MKHRRILAYIIDTLLIGILITGVSYLLKNTNIDFLNMELDALNQAFLAKEVTFTTYLNHFSGIMYDLDRQKILVYFIGILFMSAYFVFLPYKWNGQTLGKKWMHIKVVKEKEIQLQDFLIRAFLVNGLGYYFLSFLFVLFLPAFSYFLTVSILGILQIILVITSLFMLLYKDNGKSLEDTLTSTEVLSIDEVKK